MDPDLKFHGGLRLIGRFDPSCLIHAVREFDESRWDEIRARQERDDYAPHAATQTVYGHFYESWLEHHDEVLIKAVAPALREIRQLIADFFALEEPRLRRLIFTRLPGGAEIPIHHDSGRFLERHRRFHTPVFTQPDVEFYAGGVKHRLEVGCLYELNNQRKHAVRNPTAFDRVHMITDFFTRELVRW